VAFAIAAAMLACGAAQKVEAGGEQLDHAIDRDAPKAEREVNGLLVADGGKKETSPDASRAR
jgi:hypothetical protein